MKRFLPILAIIAMLTSCGAAKSVGYTHRSLSIEGCQVSYYVQKIGGQLKITVTISSDRLEFTDNPIMMLKNFEGDVLKLDGVKLHSSTEMVGIVVSGVIIPFSDLNALAQFPINEDNIPFFKPGISKVRLSTYPIVHEKEFSYDVIGGSLYSSLLRASTTEDTF